MEVLAIVIGAGLLVVSPFIPGLRPVAKTLVAGGLAIAATTQKAISTAGEQWMDVVAEAKSERSADAAAKAAAAETITISLSPKP